MINVEELVLLFVLFMPWLICMALLAPVYGKLFFSTHKVEYRTVEELAAIRQGLGLEKQTPEERAHAEGQQMASSLLSGIDEDYEEMTSYPTALRLKRAREAGELDD